MTDKEHILQAWATADAMRADDIRYPQLRMPDMQRERLNRILTHLEKVVKK